MVAFFSLFSLTGVEQASTNGVIRQDDGKRRESNASRRLGEYIFRAGNATRDDESAAKTIVAVKSLRHWWVRTNGNSQSRQKDGVQSHSNAPQK